MCHLNKYVSLGKTHAKYDIPVSQGTAVLALERKPSEIGSKKDGGRSHFRTDNPSPQRQEVVTSWHCLVLLSCCRKQIGEKEMFPKSDQGMITSASTWIPIVIVCICVCRHVWVHTCIHVSTHLDAYVSVYVEAQG